MKNKKINELISEILIRIAQQPMRQEELEEAAQRIQFLQSQKK